MSIPILRYSAHKIAQIRRWVKDCPTWLVARTLISDKLGTNPDNVTRMQKRHGFWGTSLPPIPEDKQEEIDLTLPRPIKRLFLDIETSPNLVTSWRIGRKINIDCDNIVKERAVICAAWSWDGEDEVHHARWTKGQDDKVVLVPLLAAINEADELVYQNGDRFDLPWTRTRCLFHGIRTQPGYRAVDTLKIARRLFYFNSNKLDYIARFLGIGAKIKTEFGLWKDVVLKNDQVALERMVVYCIGDITLLKRVWKRLSEIAPHKTHVGVLAGGEKWSCAHCGGEKVRLSKRRVTAAGAQQYSMQCTKVGCGGYYSIGAAAYKSYLEHLKEARS